METTEQSRKSWKSPERVVILGLLVALVLALGGAGLAESAPSSIHTCTVIKTGKIKLASKCKPGKQISITWDRHDIVVANTAAAVSNAQRYQRLLREGNFLNGTCGATISYAGIDLQFSQVGLCMRNGPSNFRGANFHFANLRGASFRNADFTNANFSNASLSPTGLLPADFRNNDFTNVNFDNSELIGVDFTGSVFTNVSWGNGTFCPDGVGTDQTGGTCVGHGHDSTGNGPGHGGL